MLGKVVKLDKTHVNDFCKLRMELFEQLGEINDNTDIENLKAYTKTYYLSHINKDLISWGVLCDGNVVAVGSLCMFNRIPYQENLTGIEGYILNVYTSTKFRKNGFASCILNEIINYASENKIKRLWLSASKQGKNLYYNFGFANKDNEMELFL